jgi:hypothetical protein
VENLYPVHCDVGTRLDINVIYGVGQKRLKDQHKLRKGGLQLAVPLVTNPDTAILNEEAAKTALPVQFYFVGQPHGAQVLDIGACFHIMSNSLLDNLRAMKMFKAPLGTVLQDGFQSLILLWYYSCISVKSSFPLNRNWASTDATPLVHFPLSSITVSPNATLDTSAGGISPNRKVSTRLEPLLLLFESCFVLAYQAPNRRMASLTDPDMICVVCFPSLSRGGGQANL